LRLDVARQKLGLSTHRLAKQAGVPVSATQRILAGQARRPAFESIWRLARAVEVPLDVLMQSLEADPHG
jgi:transcriptional regulator with XRE-family HTH domain